MKRADLVSTISEKTGIPKVDVLLTIETMIKTIKQQLIDGENVGFRGFGTFYPKMREAKVGRNIKKNIAIDIPKHFIPAFRPNKEFSNEVKLKCKSYKGKINE